MITRNDKSQWNSLCYFELRQKEDEDEEGLKKKEKRHTIMIKSGSALLVSELRRLVADLGCGSDIS